MICSDILTMASNLLCEASGTKLLSTDFSDRAPYILAVYCGEVGELDKNYREAFELEAQPVFNRSSLQLNSEFPLCDRFVSCAAFFTAAMLILDENAEISDLFFEKYAQSVSAIKADIPACSHSIKNVY